MPEIAAQNGDTDSAFELIRRRCADAGIKIEEVANPDRSPAFFVELPNGRDTRRVVIATLRDAERLLEAPFERYVFVGDYQAICSYDEGIIEGGIRFLGTVPVPSSYLFRRLFGYDPDTGRSSTADLKAIELTDQNPGNMVKITIGSMSRDLQVLLERRSPRLNTPSIRIEGVRIARHDTALEILEKLANSLFLEVDLKLGVPLTLIRERRITSRDRPLRQELSARDLQFPHSEYPSQPMSLYWYARSAIGMPLLQFLAYYQSIEFFFPIYSQIEAQRRVRNILKDPSFSAHRDTDISRLLSAIRTGHGLGYGDERSQLRATLQECIDPAELRDFLSAFPPRQEFFSKSKLVSERRLPIANVTADLRTDVADRIYDIRCKIVHTKSAADESGVDLLLPFSKEAAALDHDIELVQYLSRRVIIAAGEPLKV
jgi:hypothetical protein